MTTCARQKNCASYDFYELMLIKTFFYPVQPRQEILTYPDLETKDHQVRELIVYDTDVHARIVVDEKTEPVYNDYMAYVKNEVSKTESVDFLREIPTTKTIYWDEIHMEVRVSEEEVDEDYKKVPYILNI